MYQPSAAPDVSNYTAKITAQHKTNNQTIENTITVNTARKRYRIIVEFEFEMAITYTCACVAPVRRELVVVFW